MAVDTAMLFANATEDAGNFVDSMMSQYGWTMPGADGQYSTTNAGDAFDPNNIMSFDPQGNSTIDMSRAAKGGAGGQISNKGLFSDVIRAGASEVGEAMSAGRGRGLGRGSGLNTQSTNLAKYVSAQNLGKTSDKFFKDLNAQYGNVRRAASNTYAGLGTSQINAALTGAGFVGNYNV